MSMMEGHSGRGSAPVLGTVEPMRWTLSADGAWLCHTANGHAMLRPLAGSRSNTGFCWYIQIETSHCTQHIVRWFMNDSTARRRVEHDLAAACSAATEAK